MHRSKRAEPNPNLDKPNETIQVEESQADMSQNKIFLDESSKTMLSKDKLSQAEF